MDKKVVIIGAGGHGRVISDTILASGDTVVGFIDDDKNTSIDGFDYLGDLSEIDKYREYMFIIAIGNNGARRRIAEEYPDLGYYTAIHPSAVISHTAVIGAGTCVMPNVTVNSMAKIGEHCIINSNTVVEHDCRISDFVHLSPNVTASGTVSIGACSHIGSATAIVNNLSICGNVIVGAGSVVSDDIKEPGTYVGVPVHRIS